jgi:putative glycosyltransferase (TIGR04348 family)
VKTIVVSPTAQDPILGNSVTAERWISILRKLGHQVSVTSEWNNQPADILIALHARRSHSSIERYRHAYPEQPLIVALTGTDVYHDLPDSREAQHSLDVANRIVVLQSAARLRLSESIRAKTSVIYQSAVAPRHRRSPAEDRFDVCVLSHLRDVKDPLRAALASRLLPGASRVRIIHAGEALDPKWHELAAREQRENFRFLWIGGQSHDSALELLASCHLFVLSSTMEGGANAIAEAVVCGVPVLCSQIEGNTGMLDGDYPGYFPVGDTEQLARMLFRAESDPGFMSELRHATQSMQSRFSPEQELACWHDLLNTI